MANCSVDDTFQLPWIAKFFHSFAHVNFYFDNVSSVFAPTLQDYQQALFLYALGPCLFGGLLFLIFCGHFLASWCSCDKHQRPQAKCVIALQCIVLFTSVLCSGAGIAGFVFNETIDEGVTGVLAAAENVNESLLEIETKVDFVKDKLIDMDSILLDAKSDCAGFSIGEELIDKVRIYLEGIVTSLVRIKRVNLPHINGDIHDIEYYRRWTTFGTMCLTTLACVLMIYAILRRSRCGFVLAILVGIICLLIIWCGAGVDLALAVGMSDLCVNPKGTVNYYVNSQPVLKNTGVVKYYMDCPLDEHNPNQKYADKAMEHLEEALRTFLILMERAHELKDHLPPECEDNLSKGDWDLHQSQESVSIIAKNLDCGYAHEQFKCAQYSVCYYIVEGVAELFLMTLLIGFFLIINLTLVLPILLRTPSSKGRKHRSILHVCGSDSPIGTPYQSISEEDPRTESVPLIPNDLQTPTYNAMHRSSMEFHSFEDSWKPGRFSSVGANPLLTAASPPSSSDVSSNTDLPNIRGRGEINSMAF